VIALYETWKTARKKMKMCSWCSALMEMSDTFPSGHFVAMLAYDPASSGMSKVHIVEMADECLGVLHRQLFQKGSICNATSTWLGNRVALLPEPFQILLSSPVSRSSASGRRGDN